MTDRNPICSSCCRQTQLTVCCFFQFSSVVAKETTLSEVWFPSHSCRSFSFVVKLQMRTYHCASEASLDAQHMRTIRCHFWHVLGCMCVLCHLLTKSSKQSNSRLYAKLSWAQTLLNTDLRLKSDFSFKWKQRAGLETALMLFIKKTEFQSKRIASNKKPAAWNQSRVQFYISSLCTYILWRTYWSICHTNRPISKHKSADLSLSF